MPNRPQYTITEKDVLINKYISVPPDLGVSIAVASLFFVHYGHKGKFNCAMFVAGIIKAILNASRFVSQPMHALSLIHSSTHSLIHRRPSQ